jgi:hypothetical protein
MAVIQSHSWGSVSIIDSQLQDKIIDFVVTPNNQVPFGLVNPNLIIQGIVLTGFGGGGNNGFTIQTTYPNDSCNLLGPGFNESAADFVERKQWQIRQWNNGNRVVRTGGPWTAPSAYAYGTLEFTRTVDAVGFYYEGFNTVVNQPGANNPAYLFSPAGNAYIHALNLGPNKVELRCSHYSAAYFPFGPPNSGAAFVNYAWPSTNHSDSLKDAGGTSVDILLWQTFICYQQAVAVVKSLPTGATQATNTTFVNKLSIDEFEYDTSFSYGGDLGRFWIVEKSINNGPWTPAVGGGTDFTLLTGSLVGYGVVKFKFTGPPAANPPIRYRATFRVIGYSTFVNGNPERDNPWHYQVANNITSKGDSGPNEDSWFFIAEVVGPNTATQVVVTKTLPLVTPRVTPTTNPINNVVSVLPILEAWKILEAKAEVLIDARVAIKTVTTTVYNVVGNTSTIASGPTTATIIPSDPTITLATDPSKVVWLSEILTEHKIVVQLRTYVNNSPVVIGEKAGVGPHLFIVPIGKYDIIVKLFAKPKQIVPSGITQNVSGPPMQTQ